jgi:DNA-binding NtrC family response regulator
LQAKLLRVLEEGAFRRVGGLKDLPLDVRVIAASNRDLKSESEAGKFRLDLYYRLSVIQIDLPPLRERGDDVLLLTDHYIKNFNEKLRKRTRGVTSEVVDIFRRYRWLGNVRELRNMIERAMILEDDDLITTNWLPRGVTPEAQFAAQPQVAVATRATGRRLCPRCSSLPARRRQDRILRESAGIRAKFAARSSTYASSDDGSDPRRARCGRSLAAEPQDRTFHQLQSYRSLLE